MIGVLPLVLFIATINVIGFTTVAAAEERGKRSLLRDPKTVQVNKENARRLKNGNADTIVDEKKNSDTKNEQQAHSLRNLNTNTHNNNEEHEAAAPITNNIDNQEEEQRSLGVNSGLCLQHSIEDCASQKITYRGEEVNCCTCTKLVPFEQTVCVNGTAQFTAGWDICSKGCLEKSS